MTNTENTQELNRIKTELEEIVTTSAIYYNNILDESYRLAGIKDLEHAWKMLRHVCKINNWNKFDVSKVIIKENKDI